MKVRKGLLRINGRLLCLSALLFFLVSITEASHLRAGEIKVERDGCSSLGVIVTVTVYTDTGCSGNCIEFGGSEDVLSFGDGFSVLVPMTPSTPTGVVNVGKASYTINHTFPGPGRYIISYLEPMRNKEVVNITIPDDNKFYI